MIIYDNKVFVCLIITCCWICPLVHGLSTLWKNQIERNRENVFKIKNYVAVKEGRHFAYNRLTTIADDFGPRRVGTQNLENVLDHIIGLINSTDKFDNVHTESVEVPDWKIWKEEAQLKKPRIKKLKISVLGHSVQPIGPFQASAIVVRSFKELEKRKKEVTGSIVVFNQPWTNYSQSVEYLERGASRASEYGARAVLVRSVTPLSVASVHTGLVIYSSEQKPIPAASITVEDAELLQRLADRKIPLEIYLTLDQIGSPDKKRSRNIVAELKGSSHPDEVIIIGGHTDTWDLGDGSLDDGAGFVIAWEAVRILKALGLRPKRTIRLVLWTAGELSSLGGRDYYEMHHDESEKVSLILESDAGVFTPRGVKFSGNNTAREIIKHILISFLGDMNATEIVEGEGGSTDTSWWVEEKNVPGCELYSYNEPYFVFHHSEGDTISVINPEDMDKAVILWATLLQVVSDLDSLLPRIDDGSITLYFSKANFIYLTIIFIYQLLYWKTF